MRCLSRAALSRRRSKISLESLWLQNSRIHAECGLEEEENPAGVTVAIYSTSVFVKAASVRNSCMQVLILDQAPHSIVSYRNQVVWGIPEELMKGVSQSRFQVTMLLGLDFVNQSPGRYERRHGAGIG
jgi:hypothetical protein